MKQTEQSSPPIYTAQQQRYHSYGLLHPRTLSCLPHQNIDYWAFSYPRIVTTWLSIRLFYLCHLYMYLICCVHWTCLLGNLFHIVWEAEHFPSHCYENVGLFACFTANAGVRDSINSHPHARSHIYTASSRWLHYIWYIYIIGAVDSITCYLLTVLLFVQLHIYSAPAHKVKYRHYSGAHVRLVPIVPTKVTLKLI